MAAWARERRPIEELRHGADLVIMAAVQQMDKTAFELHKKNDKPAQPVDHRQPGARWCRNARDPFDGPVSTRLAQPPPHYRMNGFL